MNKTKRKGGAISESRKKYMASIKQKQIELENLKKILELETFAEKIQLSARNNKSTRKRSEAAKKLQSTYKDRLTRRRSEAAKKLQSTYKRKSLRRRRSDAARKIQSMHLTKKVCSICLEKTRQNNYFQTNCKPIPHVFHVKCIKEYCKLLATDNKDCKCPICRSPLTRQAESMRSEVRVEKANRLAAPNRLWRADDLWQAQLDDARINWHARAVQWQRDNPTFFGQDREEEEEEEEEDEDD